MSEDEEKESAKLNSLIPKVYDDVISPSAKEIGRSLVVVVKTVNIALAPMRGLVWGYERIEEFLVNKVAEKLDGVPEGEIVTPSTHIAVPTIEALRYCAEDETLRELFANLLASSMVKDTLKSSHPSFVEIIKQLTGDEAMILKSFSGYDLHDIIANEIEDVSNSWSTLGIRGSLLRNLEYMAENLRLNHIENLSSYFENLIRLGLLHIETTYTDNMVDAIGPILYEIGQQLKIDKDNYPYTIDPIPTHFEIKKEREDTLRLTDLGVDFIRTCVDPKSLFKEGNSNE